MQKMEEMEFDILQLRDEVGILRRGQKSSDKVIRIANTIMYKNRNKIPGLDMKRPDPDYFVKDKDLEKNYNKIYETDSYAFDRENKSITNQNKKRNSKN